MPTTKDGKDKGDKKPNSNKPGQKPQPKPIDRPASFEPSPQDVMGSLNEGDLVKAVIEYVDDSVEVLDEFTIYKFEQDINDRWSNKPRRLCIKLKDAHKLRPGESFTTEATVSLVGKLENGPFVPTKNSTLSISGHLDKDAPGNVAMDEIVARHERVLEIRATLRWLKKPERQNAYKHLKGTVFP